MSKRNTQRLCESGCGSGKGEGISITPYAAGRLLGGSMWRVSCQGEDYVYAVDLNHRKERLVAIGRGGTPEELFHRPALLITGMLRTDTPPLSHPSHAHARTHARTQRMHTHTLKHHAPAAKD